MTKVAEYYSDGVVYVPPKSSSSNTCRLINKINKIINQIKSFGGRGLSGFGDIATFKNGHISLFDHGL